MHTCHCTHVGTTHVHVHVYGSNGHTLTLHKPFPIVHSKTRFHFYSSYRPVVLLE